MIHLPVRAIKLGLCLLGAALGFYAGNGNFTGGHELKPAMDIVEDEFKYKVCSGELDRREQEIEELIEELRERGIINETQLAGGRNRHYIHTRIRKIFAQAESRCAWSRSLSN